LLLECTNVVWFDLAEEGVLSGERGHYRLVKAPTEIHISPTVQGVLAARIDRLSREEKELLQQLAVIGREFPLSLARRVISQPEEELYRLLSSLQSKEFLYEQPAFPEVEYLFKHALTQEVAYNSMLHDRRKALHEQTAKAIEALYSADLDEHYSELAHHYNRSGNTEKAVQYLGLAGQQAVQRSAYMEAVSQLTLALDLLTTLPDTLERARQELTLRIALGVSLMAISGLPAPEVGQTFIRAHELCQQIGETPQLFAVLRGLWNFYLVRAEYKTARETAEQFLSLAQRLQDPTFLLGAHEQMGFLSFWPAEWIAAREHHEQAITFYDPQKHSTYVSLYGADLGVWSFAQAAVVLWCLGYPEQALQKSREALRLAHELGHPFSTGWVLICAAWLHQLRREPQEANGLAEAAITLSTDQGFLSWLALGTVQRGWALAQQGQGEEGIAQLRQGMDACRAAGQEGARTYFLALLAEAYGHMGQSAEGLSVLTEALDFAEKTGEWVYEPELYRLKQRPLQFFFMPGRLQILGDQPQGLHPHRHIAHLLPLPFNAKLQHSIAPLQIPDLQLTQFLPAHAMIGQRSQDCPIPLRLQRIPLGRSEQRSCLFIAERRRRPFLAVRLGTFDPVDGIMEDRVLLGEVGKQGRQCGQLALNRGRRTALLLQVLAPGNHMHPRDGAKLLRVRDPDEATELAEIIFIGFARIGVAQIGKPFKFRGHFGQFVELRRRECPALPCDHLHLVHPPSLLPRPRLYQR
jgi:tetratricopeptide (TPR) repeat protein